MKSLNQFWRAAFVLALTTLALNFAGFGQQPTGNNLFFNGQNGHLKNNYELDQYSVLN